MNNSNGTALLASLKPGNLVTVRDARGQLVTGRAYASPDGLFMRTAARFIQAVTAGNIVRITP